MPYKNKEDKKAYQKVWEEANKEKRADYKKAYKESLKEGHYSVYYLPEEHYAGVTTGLKHRMHVHNSDGMITEGFEVLFTSQDKKEALAFEDRLHSMGCNGSIKDGYLSRRRELTQSLKEAA